MTEISEVDFINATYNRVIGLDFIGFLNSNDARIMILKDKDTGAYKETKHWQLLKMENVEEGCRHGGIIIYKLGKEYQFLPKELADYLATNKGPDITIEDPIELTSMSHSDYKFSGTVYLYTTDLQVPREDVVKAFKDNDMRLIIRGNEYRKRLVRTQQVDFFICHDSTDKDVFVRPLADAMRHIGLNVFYDEFSIRWGDSLIDRIEEGLQKCKFGIVVLSKSFIKNTRWPHTEFRSLKTREIMVGKSLILPIWLDVTEQEVADYSLDLKDRSALRHTDGIDKIVQECVFKIKSPYRPDEYYKDYEQAKEKNPS